MLSIKFTIFNRWIGTFFKILVRTRRDSGAEFPIIPTHFDKKEIIDKSGKFLLHQEVLLILKSLFAELKRKEKKGN